MATVYLANDLEHEREVALKAPHPELVSQLGAERFLREIQISTKLQHPNIVAVYSSGTHEGIPFYVMPFVVGETLEQKMRREGALPIGQAIDITCDIAEGLAYAHELGFVHRDVKPANVLLSHGRALLADFGIAKAVERVDAQRLTESGFALGTADYMSPEQVSAVHDIDGRSDVYSLACVLYEMLSGSPPFGGSTARSVMARHLMDPVPPLRTVRETVSPALEEAVVTAMAKMPADRFVGAAAFRDALRAPGVRDTTAGRRGLESGAQQGVGARASGAAGTVPATRPGGGSRASRRWRFAAVGAATMAVAAAAWWVSRPASPLLDRNRIMVYPLVLPDGFAGAASTGEDVAAIIGNALGSAAPLRWVDGWALLEGEARRDVRQLTLEQARALARDKRCATMLTGRVVSRGDSAQVFVSLYDVAGDSVLAEGEGIGAVAEPWRQGLRAVNLVLPRLIPSGASDLSAEWTNRNPTAVAAFLMGEAAFRRVQPREALAQYRRALGLDSTFAQAALRGAQAATWAHQRGDARSLLQAALRRPLSAPDEQYARGYLAYLDGRTDSAEVHLRAALSSDRDLAVAWTQLGEVYTHLLPLAGNPDSLADRAFSEARRLDSAAANLLLHPIEIRLRAGDASGAAGLLSRFLAGAPDSSLARQLAIMTQCVRDGAARVEWRHLARTQPLELLLAGGAIGGGGRHVACAEAAFTNLLAVDTAATDSADARRFAALLGQVSARVAQNRPQAAIAGLDSAISRWGFGASLYLLAAPFVPEMAERGAQVALEDERTHGPSYARLPYQRRLWELGVLEARRGRMNVAEEVVADLERRATADGATESASRLSRSVRAHALLQRGDSAGAERLFRALLTAPINVAELAWDEAEAMAGERLRLAELLLARGAAQEALDVASVHDAARPVVHLLVLRQSLELRARAASALGNSSLERHYRSRLSALGGEAHPTGT